MGSTLTTFDALLKERYIDSSKVEELIYPDNVLLGMLEKRGDSGMVGDVMPVPVVYGNPQGLGISFSTAQTNNSNIKAAKWSIQAGSYHGVVDIGDKVLKASRTNQGAFLENKVTEIDGLYMQAGENLSIYTWGNGGQALGRRASISSNDVSIVEGADAGNFEPGMKLVASAADGASASDALRGGTAALLDGINRATGVLTSTTWGNITTFSDQDFLFRESDFFGTVGNTVIKGVQAFIPATDTLPDLWGVLQATRQADVQRFGGCRVADQFIQGRTYEERIRILISQMTGRFKSRLKNPAGFMHPEEFEVLSTFLSARGIRPAEDSSTAFGYSKIDINSSAGVIPIYADRHCPKGSFFLLSLGNWWVSSMKELLHPQNEDGFSMLRRDASTDYEFRLLSYPLLACNAPKNSGRVSLL